MKKQEKQKTNYFITAYYYLVVCLQVHGAYGILTIQRKK